MSIEFNALIEILGQIGDELTNQISLTKTSEQKIDTRKLSLQSNILNSIILSSKISKENKLSLQKFSLTLVQDNTTLRNLRYEKQDLERVLANLTDI